MRFTAIIFILLLGCSVAVMAKDLSWEQSVKNAGVAPLKEQPRLFIKIAQDQLRAADNAYKSGNAEGGKSAVSNLVEYCGKATDAAVQSGSRLKDTEIDIRKMADKLRDIKRNLNYDDQAPVQAAIDKLEDMRSNLLKRMFEAKKK